MGEPESRANGSDAADWRSVDAVSLLFLPSTDESRP